MESKYANLIDKLNYGMPYLFLGQDYWHDANSKLYSSISEKLGLPFMNDSNIYYRIDDGKRKIEDIMQFIQTEMDYTMLPLYGKILSIVGWNGVITSAVETFTERILKIEREDVQPVYNVAGNLPYDFKSKQTLHISYLYGCVNQVDKDSRPPLSLYEKATSNAKADNLLSKIDSVFLSPMGILVIDGYNYATDWLSDEKLFSICSGLLKEQVYFFDFKEEYRQSIYINKLIDDGIVVPINDSLVTFIERIQDLLIGTKFEISSNDFVVSIDGERRIVPHKIAKNISRNCLILDDFTFSFDENKNVSKFDLFRDFLYKSSIEPVWYAYHYKMNIVRDYEEEVYTHIIGSLRREGTSQRPIVIFGQTGTGKTVSLASLAYRLKMEKKYPILYITASERTVNSVAIEDFCNWCNDSKVVVFWDLSTHGNGVIRYKELNDYLASKGKKAVIVGTSYYVDDEFRKNNDAVYIEAPVTINSEREINAFREIYEKMTEKKLDAVWNQKFDNNFLVALFRLLPNTNYNIRKGLLGELSVETVELSELLTFRESISEMALLLKKCGVSIPNEQESQDSNRVSITKIIRIVSVIGQFGMPIPFDIMYRMLSEGVSYLVGTLLDKIDFLHVDVDADGDIKVFPRSSLEAKIVANSTMISMEDRIDLIKDVISNVSDKETDFLVELLRAIGPNGTRESDVYKAYYGVIAAEVTKLRTEGGVFSEGTILQETSYIREYFKDDSREDRDVNELKIAQELLEDQLKQSEKKAGDSFRNKIFYGQLLIELASNLGTEIKYLCGTEAASTREIMKLYEKFNKCLDLALVYSPDPYYPIDIWGWTVNEILDTDISEDEKIELKSKLISVFERVKLENPEIVNRVDYNHRIVYIKAFENETLSKEAFERLLQCKSDAGIYLRTRQILLGIDLKEAIDDACLKKIRQAIDYLEKDEYKDIVYSNSRTLFLLFKLYWLSVVKEPIFASEKKILPFSRDEWEKIYSILIKLESLLDEVSAQLRLLIGICEFHLGSEDQSFYQLDGIRNNYYLGVRRPRIYFIASNPEKTGEARSFSGQLKELEPTRDRARFYVPELRKDIYYYNRDFVAKAPNINVTYDGLHIGFSYMGIRISDIV